MRGGCRSSASKLSNNEGVDPLGDAVALPEDGLLELAVGLAPLLHEEAVLAELADQVLDEFGLGGEFLEQHVLGEGVHDDGLLEVVLEVVDDEGEGVVVAVDDGGGPAVGEAELLLHVGLHGVEFLDGLVDDADGVLADHHVVLADLLGHEVDLVLELAELVDQRLRLLLVPDRLQLQDLLHALQRLDLVALVLAHLVHAGHADDCLVVLAVEVEQVPVVPADGLGAQESQQVLDVFLGAVDVFEGEDVVVVEVEFVVDLLQRLQDEVGVLGFVLHRSVLLDCALLLEVGLYLAGVLLQDLGRQVEEGLALGWRLGAIVAAAGLRLKQHVQINNNNN